MHRDRRRCHRRVSNTGAEISCMLVKRRFEPALAQATAAKPFRRDGAHGHEERTRIDVWRAEDLQRAVVPRPWRASWLRASPCPRSTVPSRRWCVGTGIHPRALAVWAGRRRPRLRVSSRAWRSLRTRHQGECERGAGGKLSHVGRCRIGKGGAYEAFPPCLQRETFDGTPAGFGRSSTHTALPWVAAASST